MDPVETLKTILDGCRENDPDTAAEACRDLADWLERGGFCPYVDYTCVYDRRSPARRPPYPPAVASPVAIEDRTTRPPEPARRSDES